MIAIGGLVDRVRRSAFVGAIALASIACGPEYERTEFSATVAELGGSVSVQRLELYEGMIVKSHIVAWNDDREPMPLLVRTGDPATVEVAGVISPHDYAFVGRQAGTTKIEFVADGTLVLVIEAVVLPQPDLP